MIFTFSDYDKGFDSIFHGRSADVQKWVSVIPSPDVSQARLFDPNLQSLWDAGSSSLVKGVSYIGNLYLYNAVTAVRTAIGKMATVVGFLKSEFTDISNSFKEEADTIQFVFNTVNSVINSQFFQQGLDALGAIPIVGWIIKIVAKIAEAIYKLVNYIIKNKINDARKQLTGQPWIPLVEFSKDADQEITKFCMNKIASGEMEYLFSPGHYYEKFEDFYVRREKRTGSDNAPLEKTDFFNITSLKAGGGLGFIPGGTAISGPIRFPTGACSEVFNAGDLYPSAANLATSIYQIVQKEGPALYSVHADSVSSKWKNTISSLLDYAEKSIKLGWTCSVTGEFNSNTFTCNYDTVGAYANVEGCKRKAQIGKIVPLPSGFTGHYGAFRNLISKLFFSGSIQTFDPKQSTPVKALQVLKERQYAVIDSLKCIYVNDSIIPNTNTPRFPAIKNDSVLRSKWLENVNAVLNSKDDWKKVVFYDVPEGEIKEKLREKAKKANLNPEKAGPIDNSLTKISMPSVLPNPKPPSPFTPQDTLKGKPPVSSSSSPSGIGMVAIAGAALGLYFLKNK